MASMGKDPLNSKVSELMRLGAMPTADEIKSGIVSALKRPEGYILMHLEDPLQIDVSSVQAKQKIAGFNA